MTSPNSEIIDIAKKFSKNKYEAIFDSLQWMKNNLGQMDYNQALFRKRSAAEIIKSKKCLGCTDTALVFLSFMQALEIKATYLEAVSEKTVVDFIKYPGERIPITGHVFVRVVLDGRSMIVDPDNYQILLRNNLPAHSAFPDEIAIAEGKDFIEIDTDSEEKIEKKAREFVQKNIK